MAHAIVHRDPDVVDTGSQSGAHQSPHTVGRAVGHAVAFAAAGPCVTYRTSFSNTPDVRVEARKPVWRLPAADGEPHRLAGRCHGGATDPPDIMTTPAAPY
jgi:hypothetical protein